MRETFDSSVRVGKRTLEALGVEPEMAEKLGNLFFQLDRESMEKLARLYNPSISTFDNQAFIDEANRLRQEGRLKMQALLNSPDREEDSA